MSETVKQLLKDTEIHLIGIYRALNPSANYETPVGDEYEKGNRTADNDAIVARIRVALAYAK